jgi:hypothetical protein
MPDNITSGIPYPQAPQPQQNALTSNPLQLLNNVLSLKKMQQDLAARQAIGNAYQKNIGADGSLDISGAFKAIRDDPDAAIAAPQASTDLLAQRGQMIANSTAQFQQGSAQNRFIADAVGTLADKQNVTPNDVDNMVVTMARNTNIPSQVLAGWRAGMPSDPKKLRQWLIDNRKAAMGSAGVSPIIPGAGGYQNGAPVPGTVGQGIQTYAGGAGDAPGANRSLVPPAPGEDVTQKGAAEAAARLEDTARTSPQYHADLENLKQESQVLGPNFGGPTADFEIKANALTNRLGHFGITMSPDQMKAATSFQKITNQISLNQSSALAGTDAGRLMTVHANPSLEATPQGREGVIDQLQGNQDFVDKARDLWIKAKRNGAPANSHYDFMQSFGSEPLNAKKDPKTGEITNKDSLAYADPRVFQFNRLSRENQQTFLKQVDPDELPQFERNFKEAIARGWVKPLKKPNADQQK